MIIICELCHSFFDSREREPLGSYPNTVEACPDCAKRVREEDAAIDRAIEAVLA